MSFCNLHPLVYLPVTVNSLQEVLLIYPSPVTLIYSFTLDGIVLAETNSSPSFNLIPFTPFAVLPIGLISLVSQIINWPLLYALLFDP